MSTNRSTARLLYGLGAAALIGVAVLAWLLYSERRLDEYNFKQFIVGSFIPAYQAKHHRWPADFSEVAIATDDVGPYFEQRMIDIKDRSNPILIVRIATAHEFRASIKYRWPLGGVQEVAILR